MHVLTQERIELGAGLKDIAVEVVDRAIKAGAMRRLGLVTRADVVRYALWRGWLTGG